MGVDYILIPAKGQESGATRNEIVVSLGGLHEFLTPPYQSHLPSIRNSALAQSNKDYVVMVQDGVTGFRPGWDRVLLEPLSDPDVLLTAARIIDPTTGKQVRRFGSTPLLCCAFRNDGTLFDGNMISWEYLDADFCRLLKMKNPNGKVVEVNMTLAGRYEQDEPIPSITSDYFGAKWWKDLKIVGLCKTFSGHEFVEAALEAVYPFLDKIVFVNSDISWLGKPGNTVRPLIEQWQEENDSEEKIVHLNGSWKKQMDQYDIGYRFIRENYDCDWIFVFDTDEVWDKHNWELVTRTLAWDLWHIAVATRMKTYVKSPFFRIDGDPATPTSFIRPVTKEMIGIRGGESRPKLIMPNIFFHHFTFVREQEEDVFEKIRTSIQADSDEYFVTPIDLDWWIQEKWNKLPDAENFNVTIGYESTWRKVTVIKEDELPETVQGKPIIQRFL